MQSRIDTEAKRVSGSSIELGNSQSSAIFSIDKVHRYSLTRVWSPGGKMAVFIGLNPSTADEVENDPTVRRCINYAKAWGCDGLYMLNIFAFRGTDPKDMKVANNPIGLENDFWLLERCKGAEVIIAAWGVHGEHQDRGKNVMKLLDDLDVKCLGTTKEGHPRHPLYLRKDLQPTDYNGRGGLTLSPRSQEMRLL